MKQTNWWVNKVWKWS